MKMKLKGLIPVAAVALLMTVPGCEAIEGGPFGENRLGADRVEVRSLREVDDDNRTASWRGLTVNRIEDMEIVDRSGRRIGEVDEVLADEDGRIVAVAADVGGFLGIGDREVVISLDQLDLQGDRFVTRLTSRQMEALPRWDND